MFFTILVSLIFLFTGVDEKDDSKKRAHENLGLITTYCKGDKAPTGHYFYIVSSIAIDSTTANVDIDIISKNLMLSNAFYNPQYDSVFRFDKDPYELYYKILLGRSCQSAIDVTTNILQPCQSLSVNMINNGSGQNFYLKHVGNGRYKIYHCSGKIVTISLNKANNCSNAILTDDTDSPESKWIFVDSGTHEIYKPF
ncbi:MAG TPA: hypothetical protein PKW37_10075 [Salinivirgaceae bacterium]|nr:hypothetical protein [Salinivirgaceae bacterium]